MADPYVNDEFQDFLKLLDEYGWDKKVKFKMAKNPPVPYVVVEATPNVFRYGFYPAIEIDVCWHTYGSEDGSYQFYDANLHDLCGEESWKRVSIHEIRTFVKENPGE